MMPWGPLFLFPFPPGTEDQRPFFSITSFTQEKPADTVGKPVVLISKTRA
jgi:hypothetical protein